MTESPPPGLTVAIDLVNELVIEPAPDARAALEALFAFDPASVADRPGELVPEFAALAERLHAVVVAAAEARVDDAARRINELLTDSPAVPHLELTEGRWTLHHHAQHAGVVAAWTAICAEALARLVDEGRAERVHLCESPSCGRAFIDTTKSGTRRFCSERCQNREKAAARRSRG